MTHPIIRIADANANAALCAPCGGKCCQRAPGHVFPGDLDTELNPVKLRTTLRSMLQSGRYTLDYFVGNPFDNGDTPQLSIMAYVVRPAIQGQEGRWFDDTWGGPCTFHTPNGCALAENDRPSECKALTPRPEEQCVMPEGWEGLRTAAKAWWPYRLILESMMTEYRDM